MPNFLEGVQNGLRSAERDAVRVIRRTADQVVETAGRIGEGVKKASNAPVRGTWDDNPFNDGQVGLDLDGGGLNVNVRLGLFPKGNLSEVGGSVGAKLKDVGAIDVSLGVGPVPIPGLRVENADGKAVLTTDPFEVAYEGIRTLYENVLGPDGKKAYDIMFGPEPSRATNGKPSQPGTRSRSSLLNPPGAQPGTISRSRAIQQQLPQSPDLPGGTPQTIPRFPVQGSAENEAANKAARSLGGRLPPERFQIPDEIPKTNTRLPKKPQIGGSGVQANNRSRSQSGGKSLGGSGGMALGPGNGNNQNRSSGGKTIVRPEDMEDLSPNSPTNKPRINQPSNEPRSAYRLLTPQEKSLFDCLNNGGGEACYKKFNQQKPSSNQSNNSGGANIELEFGDPYIGMGE